MIEEANVPVDEQNMVGATALHMAVEYDYYRIVEVLVKAGADLSLLNKAGFEARYGLSGEKVIKVVALTPSDASSVEMMDALAGIEEMVKAGGKLDASELVKIRTKVKATSFISCLSHVLM